MFKLIIYITTMLSLLTNCGLRGRSKVSFRPKSISVSIANDSLIIRGSGLKRTSYVKMIKGKNKYDLSISNKSDVILSAKITENVSMAIGEVFNVIIGSAYGEVIIPAVFTVTDGSITNAKLASRAVTTPKISGALGGQGVSSGQVLKWNGTDWVPANLDSLTYKGTWNPATNNPDINFINTQEVGDFYIASTDGQANIGGISNWSAGDWIVFQGNSWEKVKNNYNIVSVFGRKGAITAQSGDYTWAQINKSSSSIGDIRDVDLVTSQPNNGNLFTFNGTKWIPSFLGNDSIIDGSISTSKIIGLDNQLVTINRAISSLNNSLGTTGTNGTTGAQGPIGATGATGPQGPIGLTGPAGTTGATGPQGPIGPTGAMGPMGLTGLNGLNGIKGDTGAIGPQGPTGATGPMGLTGLNGLNGIKGDTGAVGPQGPTGLTGVAGPQGPQGLTGAVGATGPQGANGSSAYDVALANGFSGTSAQWLASLVGPQGPTGLTGATGPQGLIGLTGAQGPQGPIGLTGATGAQGPQGLTGAEGSQGPIGLTGAQGANGSSAYDIALANGFIGTSAQWLASLVGTQGPQGLTGTTGPQGPIGLTGPAGAAGVAGPQGPIGPTGAAGATGAMGPMGLTGLNGLDGAKGDTGAQGPTGATGPQGPIGLTGATGPQGAQGPQGLTGAMGATGPQGANGLSAYEIALANGYSGTSTQWLASLSQGSVGATGATGPQGPQGPIGLTGATGAQGPQGLTGATGPQGPQGPAGQNASVSNINISNLTSSVFGPLFPNAGCLSNQTLVYSVMSDSFVCSNIGNLDASQIATGTLNEAQMPASAKIETCEIIVGDPGAASAVLEDDNDSPSVCGNKTGRTMTITSVECFANTGTPTVTPIITGSGATSILTGPLTCGNGSFTSGTLNGTPSQTNNQSIDGNITIAGGSAKYIVIRITRTL